MSARSHSIVGLLALVVSACAADNAPQDGSASGGAAGTSGGAAGVSGATPIGLDAQGCLALVDHSATNPLPLSGKLVVTYFEPELAKKLCVYDDSIGKHWCPSSSATAADCVEEDDGSFWCPIANPPAAQLGDAQELALFDLSNPAAGVQRWTNNLVHENELDISPDGSKVIYNLRKSLDGYEPEDALGIWLIDMNGANATQLTPTGVFVGIPTWAPPDNSQFTYATFEGLFRFDVATKNVTPIVPDLADTVPGDPETSYDGQQITFKSSRLRPEIDATDIYIMNANGTNVRQLTTGYSDHDPVFSHDNRKIYFERYYGPGDWAASSVNKWGIVEVDAESAEERIIIPHDPCQKHYFWLPTISPDGNYLMFIHHDEVNDYVDLWVSDLNGNHAQAVPNTKGFFWFDWTE
jgi:Tol biopolymer transport system component